ncbi:MAG: hypothetical protein ACREOS_09195 [Candidatus Dormibacteraceae bacterium]
MYIALTVGRAKSRSDLEHLCQFYRTTVMQAMIANGGFQEAKCAAALDDPRALLIDEHWGSLPALEWWQTSEVHQQFLKQITAWLDGAPVTTIYDEVG